MPDINRIRVNNVKYNFGTQAYDDFTMRMYGKNTIYDLANGGGKSVLMLLLMQCLIPNCTLDEKQPVEKLFREPGNTVIHSLIEWRLDPCDRQDGYRYMTTGFAARKAAADKEGESPETEKKAGDGTASVEYFNYCIFYRNYNRNDIVNLPLEKNGKRITWRGLRNYLSDLTRENREVSVRIFDRKGEYQQFIARYGLVEMQWELIRGINRTEGHVRTYFETNYRTTRKVVLDLLVEGIIEQAYRVRTKKEEDPARQTAEQLMAIESQLKSLAEKKKGIAVYDHETELIRLLYDRIDSFRDLFSRNGKTLEDFSKLWGKASARIRSREEELGRLRQQREQLEEKQQNLHREKDRLTLAEISREKEKAGEDLADAQRRKTEAEKEEKKYRDQLNRSLAENEYLALLQDLQKEAALSAEDPGERKAGDLVYSIYLMLDARGEEISRQKKDLQNRLSTLLDAREESRREQEKQDTAAAVSAGLAAEAEKQASDAEQALAVETTRLSRPTVGNAGEALQGAEERHKALLDQEKALTGELEEQKKKAENAEKQKLETAEIRRKAEAELETARRLDAEKRKTDQRLRTLGEVYAGNGDVDPGKIRDAIRQAVYRDAAQLDRSREKRENLEKREKAAERGEMILPTSGVAAVLDYIRTRHGMQAMTGMEYLSALPAERRKELLSENPDLPYGIVAEDPAALGEDGNLQSVSGDEDILIWSRKNPSAKAAAGNPEVLFVRQNADFFTEEKPREGYRKRLADARTNAAEEERAIRERLTVKEEDFAFAEGLAASGYRGAADALQKARDAADAAAAEEKKAAEKAELCERKQSELKQNLSRLSAAWEMNEQDIRILEKMQELEKRRDDAYRKAGEEREKQKMLEGQQNTAARKTEEIDGNISDTRRALQQQIRELQTIQVTWEQRFSPFAVTGSDGKIQGSKINGTYEALTAAFDRAVSHGKVSTFDAGRENLLRQALRESENHHRTMMERLGVSEARLEKVRAAGMLFKTDENEIRQMEDRLSHASGEREILDRRLQEKKTAADRQAGRLEYALQDFRKKYGEEEAQIPEVTDPAAEKASLTRQEESLADSRRKTDARLQEMESSAKDEEEILAVTGRILKQAGMEGDGFLSAGEESAQELHEIFEETLLSYDRLDKEMERARNDMEKIRMKVVNSLQALGTESLAESVRTEVQVPETGAAAEKLLARLQDLTDLIQLEKDRVGKSLSSMEELKESFVSQCVERCLDVRTELGKLPRLSEITVDGKKIPMVKLTIPYVKDNFLKPRMEEYIDKVIREAEDKPTEPERMRFFEQSLGMRSLFPVIVTDMSAVRLMLYKRERIASQSRYLRYEEAVGSTGQSQGIYIQFLISVINYISGMYAGDGEERTKTIFIDNPFGAAKDIYIWEPIFELLKENHVQLIVPARGASPEITARFDVNYILGQQMTGEHMTTVVTEFTSRTEDTETEYRELETEQETFDFI